MANVSTKVPLDNFIQNGDQTLSELIAAVAAVNGGDNPGVADIVRDPSSGKLVQVQLTFPDSVAAAAVAAINANMGVPSAVGAVPPALAMTDLATADGLAWSGAALLGGEFMECHATEDLSAVPPRTRLGSFAGTTYTDGGTSLIAVGMHLLFATDEGGTAFTINSGDLTMKNSGGSTVPIALSSPLVVSNVTSGRRNFKEAWVDSGGKLYLRRSGINGVFISSKSYADAVAAGAL